MLFRTVSRALPRSSRGFAAPAGSVFRAPTTPALLQTTYHQILTDQVNVYGHKTCFSFRHTEEEHTYSYKEILKHQDAVAGGMIESGGRPGTVTAVALPLRVETFMSQLGTARANWLWAPLQPGSPAQTLVNQLKALKGGNVGQVIWPAKVHKTVQLDEIYEAFPSLEEHNRNMQMCDRRFPNLRQIVHTAKTELQGLTGYKDGLAYHNKHPLNVIARTIDPKSPNTIVLNANNEPALLSQFNLINLGYLTGKKLGVTEEDIICTTVQVNTAGGLALGVGMTLAHRAKLVYSSEVFDASELLGTLNEEFCTTLVATPSDLESFYATVPKVPTLNKVLIVASPDNLPSSTLFNTIAASGVKSVALVFGTYRTLISMTDVNSFTPGSIGTAFPHTQVKIVDGKGNTVPQGTTGSLVVSGFNVEGEEVNTGIQAQLGSDGVLTLQ